jgi:hypothetical protein
MQKTINIKTLHFIIFGCIISQFMVNNTANAQSFLISSVGVIAGSSNNATALQFTSNANCINVQSGIAVFNGIRNSGVFELNCTVTQEFNKLGVKMFPNPTRSVSKVKLMNLPPLKDQFTVSVMTTGGIVLSNQTETGASLFQGILLNVSSLVSGSYILKVESSNYADAIKFIKAN